MTRHYISIGLSLVFLNACEQISQFEQVDINRDGYISALEAQNDAYLVREFSQMDANQDGRLDTREYSARTPAATVAEQESKTQIR